MLMIYNPTMILCRHFDVIHPLSSDTPPFHSCSQLPHSFQSSNRNSSAPSSIVNRCVENTIRSYNSRPAALAFLCQGPRPPLYASSRECQKPGKNTRQPPYSSKKVMINYKRQKKDSQVARFLLSPSALPNQYFNSPPDSHASL